MNATAHEVVAFPRHKKRGPKVKRGPAADVVPHPSCSVLSGYELAMAWEWLRSEHFMWGTEDDDLPKEGESREFLEQSLARFPPTRSEEKMRAEVNEYRDRIRQRKQIKEWLRDLGATSADMRGAEHALAFLAARYGV